MYIYIKHFNSKLKLALSILGMHLSTLDHLSKSRKHSCCGWSFTAVSGFCTQTVEESNSWQKCGPGKGWSVVIASYTCKTNNNREKHMKNSPKTGWQLMKSSYAWKYGPKSKRSSLSRRWSSTLSPSVTNFRTLCFVSEQICGWKQRRHKLLWTELPLSVLWCLGLKFMVPRDLD